MGDDASGSLGGMAGQHNAGERDGREGGGDGLREAETAASTTAPSEVESLKRQLAELQQAYDSKVAHSQSQDDQIDRMHRDLDAYRKGESERTRRDILGDLISLYDDFGNLMTANDFSATPNILNSLKSFRDSVLETLRRNDVDIYTVPGEIYDPTLQRPLTATPTPDQTLDKRISERVRVGFRTPERVIRQEMVNVYRYQPE